METKTKAISYIRVSTQRQGVSGLGLDAQLLAVKAFAANNGYEITQEYREVESGKTAKRPMLIEAMARCKKEKAVLLIAKLDRLSRNVAFIATLMDSNVKFIAVDNPHANRLSLHIMAAMADHEGRAISTRTKEALAPLVGTGKLGKNGAALAARNRAEANRKAQEMQPQIVALQAQGVKTQREMALKLDIPERQLRRILKRLKQQTNYNG